MTMAPQPAGLVGGVGIFSFTLRKVPAILTDFDIHWNGKLKPATLDRLFFSQKCFLYVVGFWLASEQ